MQARLHKHFVFGALVVCATVLLPTLAFAQAQIVGAVRDESGGVLPGVTVEAASPAIIEKVRTAVTDDQGRYRIEALRPGIYKLTFSLTGFSTVVRDGVDVPSEVVITINADMKVGALEETITVSGETPQVDVQRHRARRSSRGTSSTRCRCLATSCRSACCRPESVRARRMSADRA